MNKVLNTTGLRKIYGSKGVKYLALDNIDMEIEEGEFVGIMGPSGAGKTTLLNIISTIDRPSSGIVELDGENIVKLSDNKLSAYRRNKLGFIFQDYNLLDTLTVKENIILPLTLANKKISEINKKLSEVSELLAIKNILKKFPYEISGGQKQRTAAARAIINNPKLVLADEPTGALDSKSSRELLECMSKLNKENKTTIMLVTHDAFAASYCKRILFIKDGRIFTELVNGGNRKVFFQKILDVLSTLGGDSNELI